MSQSTSNVPSYKVRIAPTSDGGGHIPDLSPREAEQRWLDKLRVDKSDSTVSSYHYRLKHFVEWCEDQGISSIGSVTGWDLETYETHRRQEGLAPVSLNNEIGTLQNFLEYCARIELVDESLPEKAQPPSVPREDEVDETMLESVEAERLLDYYRNSSEEQYSREHTVLELVWHTGARTGAILGLDLQDYHPDEQYITFNHRPGTPLKKGVDGERAVGLNEKVCDSLNGYIQHSRFEKYEDGRQPLFTTERGRPVENTIRAWMYAATFPCHYQECPHGRDPETCKYIDHSHASKCPSSRSPHQVRTGSITWMRNRGVPLDVVSDRVNSSPRTIKQHYDKPDMQDEMEKRRRPYLDHLSFENDDATDDPGGEEQ